MSPKRNFDAQVKQIPTMTNEFQKGSRGSNDNNNSSNNAPPTSRMSPSESPMEQILPATYSHRFTSRPILSRRFDPNTLQQLQDSVSALSSQIEEDEMKRNVAAKQQWEAEQVEQARKTAEREDTLRTMVAQQEKQRADRMQAGNYE
ncbi:hypothetical protein SBOR_6059 [Sclerotinia borealis F-4128]|uniref:Uncharacterized protein n=1 Tax=Sclerotinia borealis (strain F-4128) TaxID=1432307 RepID=W9CCI6_SCLBF|nr:hypothetical protein SBOR_6059 [Sclerotinia borealis F-4128]